MTQSTIAFPGELPPSLRCGFCGQLIDGTFFRTFKRFTCARCAGQARVAAARNQFEPISFFRAAVAGSLVALGGGIGWAVIVYETHLAIGIVASFIGVLVGKTIFATSGKRRGKPLQWLCAILSFFGVLAGDAILVGWSELSLNHSQGGSASIADVVLATVMHLNIVFTPLDFIWAAIAAYFGWRICKAPQIIVAGPYRYDSNGAGSTAAGTPLQFDTVEPERTEPT